MRKSWIFLCAISTVFIISAASLNAQNWVTFEGETMAAGKLQLAGILTSPQGDGPFPAVVLLHVCEGLKDEGAQAQQGTWAKLLTGRGSFISMEP
jgi:hypothetical protein